MIEQKSVTAEWKCIRQVDAPVYLLRTAPIGMAADSDDIFFILLMRI